MTANSDWIRRQQITAEFERMADEALDALMRAYAQGEDHRAFRSALLQAECGDIGHLWDDCIARDGQRYQRCRVCRIVDVSGVER